MQYAVYCLHFSAAVHFGNGALWDSNSTASSDTLFSALCLEAVSNSEENELKALTASARNGTLIFSDLFPFVGSELYLPKPLRPVDVKRENSSVLKKSFKKLKYIPMSLWDTYLQGKLDPQSALETFRTLGASAIRTMTATRAPEKLADGDALPYAVGVYTFREGNGLYTLAGFAGKQEQDLWEDLLHSLSFSGLGGKRSAGLGRFTAEKREVPDWLCQKLSAKSPPFMTLSTCMAAEDELETALDGAQYLLQKRSGFVASPNYAPEQRRKRDFYSFCAGSCFTNRFSGDIFDVGGSGTHPVYRYAVPLWMEI